MARLNKTVIVAALDGDFQRKVHSHFTFFLYFVIPLSSRTFWISCEFQNAAHTPNFWMAL